MNKTPLRSVSGRRRNRFPIGDGIHGETRINGATGAVLVGRSGISLATTPSRYSIRYSPKLPLPGFFVGIGALARLFSTLGQASEKQILVVFEGITKQFGGNGRQRLAAPFRGKPQILLQLAIEDNIQSWI
jgi:hypothetical protein